MIERPALDTLKYLEAIEVVFSGVSITITNLSASLTEIFGSTIRRRLKDLGPYTQFRIHCTVQTQGNSGAVVGAQYSLDGGSNFSGLDNGTAATISTATVDVSATGPKVTSWASLAQAARVDNCIMRIVTSGGDAAADPAFTTIAIEFR